MIFDNSNKFYMYFNKFYRRTQRSLNRVPYMSAHVLLNLLKRVGEKQ